MSDHREETDHREEADHWEEALARMRVDSLDGRIKDFDPFDPLVQRYYERYGELPGPRPMPVSGSFLVFLLVLALFSLEITTHVITGALAGLASAIARNKLQVEGSSGFGLALLIIASLAYRMRCRNRTLYGFLEIAFGVISIYWASREVFGWLVGGGAGDLQLGANATIPAVGGLYIIVRGYTNIEEGKGLRSHLARRTRLGRTWTFLFHRAWFSIDTDHTDVR
jgi:hypothetical protein